MPVIYALLDPGTKEVRYIGKANDLAARLRVHRWEKSHKDNHKTRWLRALDTDDPIAEILEVVTESNWADRERFWIKKYRDEGARLTNYLDGGDGWRTGKGHSEVSKAKMREAALRNGSTPPSQAGRPVSEETRERLRQAAISRDAKPPPTGGWNKGRRKSHCVRGHELNSETRYRTPAGIYAGCKLCRADNAKAYQERKLLCLLAPGH